MRHSNIEELWSEGVQPLHNLKIIDLCGSQHLISCPDLSTTPNLESLILGECTSLSEIPSSIQHLNKLESLILNGCASLSEIPSSIQHLNKLESLHLEACESLESIPNCIGLESLKQVFLSKCSKLKRLPQLPTNLERIQLDGCTSLVEIQSSFTRLHNVRSLNLEGHKSLTSIPDLRGLKSLTQLSIYDCSKLKMLPELPNTIGELTLRDVPIEEFPPSSEVLDRLRSLMLINCSMLKSLPSSIRKWKSLSGFYMENCSKIDKLPDDIGALESLNYFTAVGTAIGEVPSSISCLKSLIFLDMRRCEGVVGVSLLLPPNLLGLENLFELILSDCGITKLPDSLGDLTSLKILDLKRNNIGSIPGSIINLSKLEFLIISHCKRLRELPQLPAGTRTYTEAENCTSLERSSYFAFQNDIFEKPSILKDRRYTAERYTQRCYNFINCYNLDLEALNDVMKDTLMKIQGQAALSVKKDTLPKRTHYKQADASESVLLPASIIYPESKIPVWFEYQSRGSSIDVKLPTNWLNSNFLCFALCVVVAIPNPYRQCNHPDVIYHRYSKVTYDCDVKSKDGNRHVEGNLFDDHSCRYRGRPIPSLKMPYCGPDCMKSNHVFIGFGYYFFREFWDNKFSFQFNLKDAWQGGYVDKEHCKVEMCGVHLITGLHLKTTDESEEKDEPHLEESDEEDEPPPKRLKHIEKQTPTEKLN